jgi:hypothetical protein
MKLLLHIFKKDVRHLWLQIAVTLAIVAALGREDRWRGDWLAGQTEGWLNLLLPIAWTFLIGLVVAQEPLVGHRQFWITRPYRRSGLLSAKVLFALVFVHVPFFVEQAYVLAARGFSPAEHLPQLLWNQVLLCAALTLPAMALAALASTFTQFVMEVVGVAAAIVFLHATFDTAPVPWQRVETVRLGLTVLTVAAASMAIAGLQYFGQRVHVSRGLGVGAGIAASLLFAVFVPQSAFAVRSAFAPIREPLALTMTDKGVGLPPNWSPPNRVTVVIPVAIQGMPGDALYHVETLGSEVAGSGARYHAWMRANSQGFEKIPFDNSFAPGPDGSGRGWIYLRFDRATFDQLKNAGVEISGEYGITAYRLGETTWIPAGASAVTPMNGRCSSTVVEDRWSEGNLKFECESPSAIPVPTRVRMWHPETGREWKQALGDSAPYAGGPRWTWLSALERRQTFFRLAVDPKGLGQQWLVPQEALATAKIAVTPEIVTGYSVLKYDFRNMALGNYVAPPLRR